MSIQSTMGLSTIHLTDSRVSMSITKGVLCVFTKLRSLSRVNKENFVNVRRYHKNKGTYNR